MSEKASAPKADALLKQAMARLQAREFHAAAPLFQRAIALGSDTPEIRNNLGQALRFSGDTAAADPGLAYWQRAPVLAGQNARHRRDARLPLLPP